jgi:phosphoribosylformylglycinamidine cyclo-ligase
VHNQNLFPFLPREITIMTQDRYKESGVDIEKGNTFVKMIQPVVKGTFSSGVLTDIGGFSGLFSLKAEQYAKPVLAASTDGVGTKLKIAQMVGKHDTIGIDLVAMCVNDIIVQGAKPLFFLDYLAMGKLIPEVAVDIIRGIATGCKMAGCALIGGETAEMPGFYADGVYDLAGFVVGLVDKDHIIDGSEIRVGDHIIGISSSGLHSNGYSLARKIIFEELGLKTDDWVGELRCTIAEELLRPTKIYADLVTNLIRDFSIKGISHITGGGIIDNLSRILPNTCMAVIRKLSWNRPAIFPYLEQAGNLSETEMMRTFNNGLGLILVVPETQVEEIMARVSALNGESFDIGEIEERGEEGAPVRFI